MEERIKTEIVFNANGKQCPIESGGYVLDYKDPELLSKFISEGGRLLPRRITGVSAKSQRKLKEAVKIARLLALLPFVYTKH